MGIAQVPSPGSQGNEPAARTGLSPEQLEERLLAEELRELQQRRGGAAPQRDTLRERPDRPTPTPSAPLPEADLEELSPDDLLIDESEPVFEPDAADAPGVAAGPAETDVNRLRIDEFDEDSEVKPVVLLSPKRKPAQPRSTSEGAFMSDLERRLREDIES
jgi:hypothetical protein